MRITVVALLLCGVVSAGGADQAARLLEKGELKRAAAAALKLAEKDPKNIDAWLVHADASIALGKPNDAWEPLERAIEANPKNAALCQKLGDVFVKLAETEQVTSGDGTTIRNLYLDAERMYEEALGKDAKLADAMYGRALSNYYLARTDKAKKYAAEALAMDKDHGKSHALQGHLLYGERKYADAARKFAVAIQLKADDPQVCVRYGHCFIAEGEREKAKAAYIDAIVRHPDDTGLAIHSGLLNLVGKNWRLMAPLLKAAAEKAKNSASTWYYLGYSYFITDNFDEAVASFRKARDLKPEVSAYHYFLGYSIEKLGDAGQALDAYRKALEADPDNSEAAGRFGDLISMQEDIKSAEKLYEELIGLAPRNGWIHNNYGFILRNWAERRGADRMANPPAEVKRRIRRSGQVYEMSAKLLRDVAQIQSDTGLLFEYYPCNRDDQKAEDYFARALEISDYTYRDAFDGLNRLCRRSGNWELLRDFAEGVLGALEDGGKQAVAPVGGRAPAELKQETPGMIARAKAAVREATAQLKKKG